MPVLVGHDDAVARWAVARLGRDIVPPSAVVGWLDNEGTLTSAALFHDYYEGGNIDICLVAPRGVTRGFLRALASYVFGQLGCSRVTVRPPKSKENEINMLQRAGFVPEAVCKAYYGTDDAVQMRMLRRECRWLKHERT